MVEVREIVDAVRGDIVHILDENKKLREALAYYADAGNVREIVMIDRGERARRALSDARGAE